MLNVKAILGREDVVPQTCHFETRDQALDWWRDEMVCDHVLIVDEQTDSSFLIFHNGDHMTIRYTNQYYPIGSRVVPTNYRFGC